MRIYIFRRLLVAMPSLLIASLIVFTLPRLIPGDVVQLMLEEKAYGKDLEDLRAKLGLNRPIHVQYFDWLGSVVRGQPVEVLHVNRTVQAQLGAEILQVLAVRLLLEHELDDVTGNQAGQCEDDERGDQQRGHSDQQAAEDVNPHDGRPLCPSTSPTCRSRQP